MQRRNRRKPTKSATTTTTKEFTCKVCQLKFTLHPVVANSPFYQRCELVTMGRRIEPVCALCGHFHMFGTIPPPTRVEFNGPMNIQQYRHVYNLNHSKLPENYSELFVDRLNFLLHEETN